MQCIAKKKNEPQKNLSKQVLKNETVLLGNINIKLEIKYNKVWSCLLAFAVVKNVLERGGVVVFCSGNGDTQVALCTYNDYCTFTAIIANTFSGEANNKIFTPHFTYAKHLIIYT